MQGSRLACVRYNVLSASSGQLCGGLVASERNPLFRAIHSPRPVEAPPAHSAWSPTMARRTVCWHQSTPPPGSQAWSCRQDERTCHRERVMSKLAAAGPGVTYEHWGETAPGIRASAVTPSASTAIVACAVVVITPLHPAGLRAGGTTSANEKRAQQVTDVRLGRGTSLWLLSVLLLVVNNITVTTFCCSWFTSASLGNNSLPF